MNCNWANAEQTFSVENNGTIVATISQKEITRIAFMSSIEAVNSIAGELEYNVQGNDLYLRTSSDKPVNFFVKVVPNLTYKFIVDARDIPATQIFVNSANDNCNTDDLEEIESDNIRQKIARIIDFALYPKKHMGFSFREAHRDLGSINGIDLYQVAEISGHGLTAQRIEITNTCDEIKAIDSSQFIEAGILAVHTDKSYLKPEEHGTLIRVME